MLLSGACLKGFPAARFRSFAFKHFDRAAGFRPLSQPGFHRMEGARRAGHRWAMIRMPIAFACATLLAIPSGARAVPLAQPLRFFEGRTESVGTMKIMMHKTRRVRSLGRGTIGQDGSLTLIQDVHDDGDPPHQRTWHIRQVGRGKYAGTMTEAIGPVTIDQDGDGYRFRFKMRGGLAVEEWLVPDRDGNSGSSTLTIRKYGMTVASSKGTIRKLSEQADGSR